MCNWLTIEWILKSTNYKRLLQLRFRDRLREIEEDQITQRISNQDRSQRERPDWEKSKRLQRNRLSKISSEMWEESGSSRKLIVKEEQLKKQWSSWSLSCYRLRLSSHWPSFSKLNLYYYSFCFIFFHFQICIKLFVSCYSI